MTFLKILKKQALRSIHVRDVQLNAMLLRKSFDGKVRAGFRELASAIWSEIACLHSMLDFSHDLRQGRIISYP